VSERVRVDKKWGKATQRPDPNRQGREGPTHSWPKCGRELGSDRRSFRACLFLCPPLAHMVATHVDPSSPTLVLASLRRRFSLVHRVVSALMQRLAVYATINVDALTTMLGGKQPAASAHWPLLAGSWHAIVTDLAIIATMIGRCPFSKKTKHDHEASGSASEARRRMSPPPLPRMVPTASPRAPPPRRSTSRPPRQRMPCDRVYVRICQVHRLYARS
jgi:hypothetical protein